MSLQKKIASIFITITIIPLLVVGFLSYQTLKNRTIQQITDQLISISSIQEKRINEVLGRHLGELQLVTSRTQLRTSIKEYNETRSSISLVTIQKIIENAKESTPSIKQVLVLDTQGVVLASTGMSDTGKKFGDETYFREGLKNNQLHDIFKDEQNVLRLKLSGPFILNNKVIGVAVIVVSADLFIAVTEDYAGLGNTGEVVLVKKNQAGDVLFLNPLRFDAGAALRRAVSKEDSSSPFISAFISHEDILFGGNIKDYRGEQVIAHTHFIDSIGWGMVVKIDQAEVLSPINDLLKFFLFLVLFIILFVVVIAFSIGKLIFRPISELTVFAGNLQKGDFSQRVHIISKDEIGTLGNAFNTMAEKLQEVHHGLEQKVQERTLELEKMKNSLEVQVSERTVDLENLKNNLEKEVSERTKELNTKVNDLEVINRAMIGRELKMVELKKEIEKLSLK